MKKECTEDKILQVALREFAMHGIEGVSARQIAKEAGANHAAVNYYFGGKKEMYLEIVDRAIVFLKAKYVDIYAEIKAFLKSEKPTKKRAIAYIQEILAFSRRDIFTEHFVNFQLLIRREEVFPTIAFDKLYSDIFTPHVKIMSSLICFLKDFKTEEEAYIIANLFMSMNLSQMLCKEGILRLHNKKEFDNELNTSYANNINFIIEKTLI